VLCASSHDETQNTPGPEPRPLREACRPGQSPGPTQDNPNNWYFLCLVLSQSAELLVVIFPIGLPTANRRPNSLLSLSHCHFDLERANLVVGSTVDRAPAPALPSAVRECILWASISIKSSSSLQQRMYPLRISDSDRTSVFAGLTAPASQTSRPALCSQAPTTRSHSPASLMAYQSLEKSQTNPSVVWRLPINQSICRVETAHKSVHLSCGDCP
jgi:hypothetical protein